MMSDISRRDSALFQTVRDGMGGETQIVSLSGKSFFLRRSNDVPTANQVGGALVVEG